MGKWRFFEGKKTYDLDILLRKSDEYFLLRKYGKIDSTILNTDMDIWNINSSPSFSGITKYNFISTAGGVEAFLVSSDPTANQLVSVGYLDENGISKTEFLTLNGTTPVAINGGNKITRHQSSSIFTLKTNPISGDVFIYSGTASAGVPNLATNVYGFIFQGENRTQQALYTIPLDCYGFFVDIHGYFIKKQASISISTLKSSVPFGNNTPLNLTAWPSKQTAERLISTITMTTVKPDFRREFETSEQIPPGTDLIFSQNSDVAAAGFAIEFDLICIKKENFGLEIN